MTENVEAKAKRTINVGEFVPSKFDYWYEGGSGTLNLSSGKYDAVFKREFLKLSNTEYEFSDNCRDETEMTAFYNAIEICLGKYGFYITWI